MDSQEQKQSQDNIQSKLSKKEKNSAPYTQSENKDISQDNFFNLQASFLQQGGVVTIADGGGTIDPPPSEPEEVPREVPPMIA